MCEHKHGLGEEVLAVTVVGRACLYGGCQRQRSDAGAEILSALRCSGTPNTENPLLDVRELATKETKF